MFHRVDHNNVGDIASNPLQYFLKPDEYQVVDITKAGSTTYDRDVPMILGGGGLFGNELFADTLASLTVTTDREQLIKIQNQTWELRDQSNQPVYQQFQSAYREFINGYVQQLTASAVVPKYLWGAGHNTPLTEEVKYPSWLDNFSEIGVRDWNQGYDWVPCASCMHPAFDKKYSIKNDVVFFEHKKQLIKKFGNHSMPRFINSGNNIDQTIELLGSANIILTNSYHGAYWGVLLGKKVIVVEPWSTKFLHIKHSPYILRRNQDWKDVIDDVCIREGALENCRAATVQFWNKIK